VYLVCERRMFSNGTDVGTSSKSPTRKVGTDESTLS
jgi:hypothetical protein